MIDAWGKIPAGILLGNLYELGHFDECLSIEGPTVNEDSASLKAQYCLAQFSLPMGAAPQGRRSTLLATQSKELEFLLNY